MRSAAPASYLPASWRCTLPADGNGNVGLGFNLADGSVVRLLLDANSALALVETIAQAHVMNNRSSERKHPMTNETDAPEGALAAADIELIKQALCGAVANGHAESPVFSGADASIARWKFELVAAFRDLNSLRDADIRKDAQ